MRTDQWWEIKFLVEAAIALILPIFLAAVFAAKSKIGKVRGIAKGLMIGGGIGLVTSVIGLFFVNPIMPRTEAIVGVFDVMLFGIDVVVFIIGNVTYLFTEGNRKRSTDFTVKS